MSAAAGIAERELIGAVLNGASIRAARVVRVDDFEGYQLRRLWQAVLSLDVDGERVTIATVVARMERDRTLKDQDVEAILLLAAESRYEPRHPDVISRLAALVHTAGVERAAAEVGHTLWKGERSPEETIAALSALTATDVVQPDQACKGGSWIFEAPEQVPAVWGEGTDVLWSVGEPMTLVGSDGVGKTTLAGQIILRRVGVLTGPLLGLPVTVDERPVLYLALDRPAQAARSLRRMVSEQDRPLLDERLLVWPGPIPFDVGTAPPDTLARFAASLGAGTVVIDSLKDVAGDLADTGVGSAVMRAIQHVTAAGIELLILAHPRKTENGRQPRGLDDVYGSRMLTAACGSVVLLTGSPGATTVRLSHLKQPAGVVGPLTVAHDHVHGVSTLAEHEAGDDDGGDALLDALVAEVEREPGRSQGPVIASVKGSRSKLKRDTLAEAVARGRLRIEDGPRRAKLFYPALHLVPMPGTTPDEVVQAPRPDTSSRTPSKGGRTRSASTRPETPDEVDNPETTL